MTKKTSPLPSLYTLAFVAAVGLAGCSNAADVPPADAKVSAEEKGSSANEQLPVADAFGPAEWSISIEENSRLTVTPTRLIAIFDHTVLAWDNAGQEQWLYEAPEGPVSFKVLNETVAVISATEEPGEGLATDQESISIEFLSLASGESVTETTIPLAHSSLQSSQPIGAISGLAFRDVEQFTGFVAVDESGKATEIETSLSGSNPQFGVANGTPYWADGAGEVQAEGWVARDLGLGMSGVLFADDRRGLLLLANTSVPGRDSAEVPVMLQANTGAIIYEVECPNSYSKEIAPLTSPNGRYGAYASGLVYSTDQHRCVGGGEGEKQVLLTAVSDDGVAYGTVFEGTDDPQELVVAPISGEPKVLPLPESATAPVGVMTDNIAIHWNESTGVVTGNPIR